MPEDDSVLSLEQMAGWDWRDIHLATLSVGEARFTLTHTLRFLPGKRLVAAACPTSCGPLSTQSDTDVVLKCMFGDKGKQDAVREQDNLLRLAKAGVCVPAVQALHQDQYGAVLVLEKLTQGMSLSVALEKDVLLVTPLLDQLARLFEAGFYQQDIHPDNFLLSDDQLYVLDAGKIMPLPAASRARTAILTRNMALLLAQFPASQHALTEQLYQAVLARFAFISPARLRADVNRMRRVRIRRYLQKTRRKSSAVTPFESEGVVGLADRTLAPSVLDKLITAMLQEHAEVYLKRGNSATVFRYQDWVIKRYNLKGTVAGLKRKLGRDRALRAWMMGRSWNHFGFATPQPLVYARREDGVTYLVTPFVQGQELSRVLAHAEGETAQQAVAQAQAYLDTLHQYQFWHGDTKARNFLVTGDSQASLGVQMIDLDAAGWGGTPWYKQWYCANRQQKDQLRFQRNLQQ